MKQDMTTEETAAELAIQAHEARQAQAARDPQTAAVTVTIQIEYPRDGRMTPRALSFENWEAAAPAVARALALPIPLSVIIERDDPADVEWPADADDDDDPDHLDTWPSLEHVKEREFND